MTAAVLLQAWLWAQLHRAQPKRVPSVPPACVAAAARAYDLPEEILWSTLKVQGGELGQLVRDSNGTYDIGPMQINSSWLPELNRRFGLTMPVLAWDPCINVATGSWILKRYMLESGSFWTGVAWYQSHRPSYGVPYALKVWRQVLRDARHPR